MSACAPYPNRKEKREFPGARPMKSMKSKDRKRLTNAMKRFRPEQSRQFVKTVKQQLAAGTASQKTIK
jgi:hypothetical protein